MRCARAHSLDRACAARTSASSAAAAFGLFVLAYLWPVLVGGKILSPTSLLYELPPWQARSRRDDLGSYLNRLLVDVPFGDYPWRFLAAS